MLLKDTNLLISFPELISLTLGLPDVSWPGAKDYGFSDVIYKHGLAKMPKLQTTKLWGKFQVIVSSLNNIIFIKLRHLYQCFF